MNGETCIGIRKKKKRKIVYGHVYDGVIFNVVTLFHR